jgi:hypothetical protein
MIEPRRLLDLESEAASELGTALREARSATGNAEQLARLRDRLGEGGAGAGAQAGGVQAGAAMTGLATLTSIKGWTVLGAVVLGALGTAAYVLAGARDAVPASHAQRAAGVAPRRDARDVDPVADRAGEGVAAHPAEPAQPNAAPPSVPEQQTTPTPARSARGRSSVVRFRPRNDAPARAPSDPNTEIVLLTRAEQALEIEPAATLLILHEHAQRFPDGVLAQEREILRIDAELALGRKDAAAARAREFLLRFPGSPHRHRFEEMIGVQPQAERDHKIDAPRTPTSATPARR